NYSAESNKDGFNYERAAIIEENGLYKLLFIIQNSSEFININSNNNSVVNKNNLYVIGDNISVLGNYVIIDNDLTLVTSNKVYPVSIELLNLFYSYKANYKGSDQSAHNAFRKLIEKI